VISFFGSEIKDRYAKFVFTDGADEYKFYFGWQNDAFVYLSLVKNNSVLFDENIEVPKGFKKVLRAVADDDDSGTKIINKGVFESGGDIHTVTGVFDKNSKTFSVVVYNVDAEKDYAIFEKKVELKTENKEGKMKKYRVYYKQTETFVVEVCANSEDEAIKIADECTASDMKEVGELEFEFDDIEEEGACEDE